MWSAAFLTVQKNNIVKENRENPHIVSSITSYRDLSQFQPLDNLYNPDFLYHLSLNNLNEEIENLISRECCFTVSHSYEVFETFLIKFLTDYLINNPIKLVELGLNEFFQDLKYEEIKKIIEQQNERNNKGRISLIRKISKHFNEYENNNIYKVNISHWFDLVSMVRHTLVHGRHVISKKMLAYLDKNKANKANELFDRHFQRKIIDNKSCIFLHLHTTIDIISWLNTYAHFIFKSVSIEHNLSLNIQQYSIRNL
jgi:tetratricopeptide (TPR) repeat protein